MAGSICATTAVPFSSNLLINDRLVNNAGVSFEARRDKWLRTHEVDVAEVDASWKINARGVFLGCKYAAAQMLKQEPIFGQDRGWSMRRSWRPEAAPWC